MDAKEVAAAIKSGKVTIKDILEEVSTDGAYVRAGSGYKQLIYERPVEINGGFSKLYSLGPKINGKGDLVAPKPRSTTKLAKTGKK